MCVHAGVVIASLSNRGRPNRRQTKRSRTSRPLLWRLHRTVVCRPTPGCVLAIPLRAGARLTPRAQGAVRNTRAGKRPPPWVSLLQVTKPIAWKNFDVEQVAAIAKALPPIGERAEPRPCPSCNAPTLRWYSYSNPFRRRSQITYVWCSSCRHYSGETTSSPGWDLPDPLGGATSDDRVSMEGDLEGFFHDLDDLWTSGALPQVRGTDR